MVEQHDEEESLRQEIIEGCCVMWEINVETEREFHPLEEEVAHINPPEWPPMRRRVAHPT